ncbi:phage tail protein, partial [Escherichia coli]|nr:phage tail protein [Escherichia coli]
MSAGTLTLTHNSDAVAGSGTAFTTEVAAGDFIVVTVGGVPYTLPVKSVESSTALTLVSYFTGPTQSGAAWSAVPRVALNMVTAALVAQSAEALRGLNYDKQNWQQFFTATGDVTITLPDNSQTTGPSAKKLISSVGGKADKTDLDKKADSHFPSFTGIMNFDKGAASIYQTSYVMIMRTDGVDRLQLSSNGIYLVSVMDAAGGYRSRQG